MCLTRQSGSVTELLAASPMASVPASWCVVPRPSGPGFAGLRHAKHRRHVPRRLVHRLPKQEVLSAERVIRALVGISRIGNADKRPADAKVRFRRIRVERHAVVRVLRLHLADAADGDDDVRVVGVAMGVKGVDVGDLLEQLGFRIVCPASPDRRR